MHVYDCRDILIDVCKKTILVVGLMSLDKTRTMYANNK